jgi:hypothetical protein
MALTKGAENMSMRKWTLGLGAVGLGLVLIFGNTGRNTEAAPVADDAGAVQEGVEAQGRGPVHEAFAEPGVGKPLPTPVVARKPPDPIEEAPPDQKPEGDNVHWISGYWAYDEDRSDYIWISGCWRAYPPNRVWMPGHWAAVGDGWQWSAGFWSLEEQQDATLLPPPPETIDAGPSAPAPQSDSVYVTGCWVYRTSRYVWRPGFWYVPRPGFVWCPARYVWTPCGCIFVDGYWDYPLEVRGCLFAPVCIERRFYCRPHWVYRPCCVVYHPALVCSLFVRPSCGCYYFGDYFEPRYRRLGFVAWVDFRIGRSCCDPLFAYCRWQYRGDRVWERNLRNVYIDRYRGTYPRPPRTLIQQTTVINNIHINKTVNVTNIRNVTMIAPITRVDRTIVKLQPVPRATRTRELQAIQHQRTMAQERQQTTARVIARGPAPTRPTDKPRVSKLTLPRVPAAVKSSGPRIAPPPTPAGARSVPKPRNTPRPEVKPVPRPTPRPAPKPIPHQGPRGPAHPLTPVERGHGQPVTHPAPNSGPPTRINPAVKPAPRPGPAVNPAPRPANSPRPAVTPAPKPVPRPATSTRPMPRPAVQPGPKPAPRPVAKPPSHANPVRPAIKPAAGSPARPVTRPAAVSTSRPAPRPARTATPTKGSTNSGKSNRKN